MRDKNTDSVIDIIQRYQADYGHVGNYGYLNIERIRADAGTQFTSLEFKQYCWRTGIHLVLAAPKKQYQNHLAEGTWQTISTMARSLLVHARLPDTFMYHALSHACKIFNVLPVKELQNSDGNTAAPYELFVGSKPKIHHFRVFGCPVVARKWSTTQNSSGKQTERGIQGIFIGLDDNQKGYLFYAQGSRQIYTSGDVIFDESFWTTIATNWQMLHDCLSLRPVTSAPPTLTQPLNALGQLNIFLPFPKRGKRLIPTMKMTTYRICFILTMIIQYLPVDVMMMMILN
jgi:hypothetical protein